jgi:hypothetical protein
VSTPRPQRMGAASRGGSRARPEDGQCGRGLGGL